MSLPKRGITKQEQWLNNILPVSYKLALNWPNEDDKLLRIIGLKYRTGDKDWALNHSMKLAENYRGNKFKLGKSANKIRIQRIAVFLQNIGNKHYAQEVYNKLSQLSADNWLDNFIKKAFPSKTFDDEVKETDNTQFVAEIINLASGRNKSWIAELADTYERFKIAFSKNVNSGIYPVSLVQEIENVDTYRKLRMVSQLRRELEDLISKAGMWKEYNLGSGAVMINELTEISVLVTLFCVEQRWVEVMKLFVDKCMDIISRAGRLKSDFMRELPGIAIGIAGWFYLNEGEFEREKTLKLTKTLPLREQYLTYYQISKILIDELPLNI